MSWSRESRHARGYGSAWDRIRLEVLRRDNGVCQCADCKKTGRLRPATEVDHRIPKAAGGKDDMDNLSAINRECHRIKSAKDRGHRARTRFDANGNVIWP